MVELIAKTPLSGLLPLQIGGLVAVEAELGALTSLSPYKRKMTAFKKAVKSAHGLSVPDDGKAEMSDQGHLIWFGRGEYLLTGRAADEELASAAAVVDQSDAWACVELRGAGIDEVMSRMTPIDTRIDAFPVGTTARTLIQHMNGSVTRTGLDTLVLMVFRSMAATLVHDLKSAMETVAAKR